MPMLAQIYVVFIRDKYRKYWAKNWFQAIKDLVLSDLVYNSNKQAFLKLEINQNRSEPFFNYINLR